MPALMSETARPPRATTILHTTLALVAFALNSLLCRMALRDGAIDPASFTTVRLASGALTLLVIVTVARGPRTAVSAGGWISAAMLATYAVAFSFAYLELNTGTGALILFGAVQVTMIGSGLGAGERLRAREWIGISLALLGFLYLVLPGLEAPSPGGAALMAGAGVAWGIYSLRGRRAADPVAETGGNFLRALPLGIAVSLLAPPATELGSRGVLLAIASGALTSGLGYVAWYAALRGLSATRAATLQLAVPVMAAFGGVLLLSEEVTPRLVVAAVIILGGVRLSLGAKASSPPTGASPPRSP